VGKTFDCRAVFTNGKTSEVILKVVSLDQNGTQHLRVVGAHRS
jgi:hypothetical protein